MTTCTYGGIPSPPLLCQCVASGTYFFCSPHSILELFINFLGVILFVAVGAICIEGRRNETLGLAIGILAIATGVVFLVDFVFAVRHTKFTTTTTTITRG